MLFIYTYIYIYMYLHFYMLVIYICVCVCVCIYIYLFILHCMIQSCNFVTRTLGEFIGNILVDRTDSVFALVIFVLVFVSK